MPIGKRILIQPVEEKHGALIVRNQKPTQFKVVALGDEVTKAKLGDVIYLEKHYGVEIDFQGEKYLVIDESSILAKLD
jgi:chaperonin GroES